MRDLAILTFVSLDGVMQAPSDPAEDLSGDFQLPRLTLSKTASTRNGALMTIYRRDN